MSGRLHPPCDVAMVLRKLKWWMSWGLSSADSSSSSTRCSRFRIINGCIASHNDAAKALWDRHSSTSFCSWLNLERPPAARNEQSLGGGGRASAKVGALAGAWGASPSATWGGGGRGEGQGGAGVAHRPQPLEARRWRAGVAHRRQALGARRWRPEARLQSLVHSAAPSPPLPLAHPMRGRRCSRRLALSSAWRGALAPPRHSGAYSGRWSAPARSPVACAPVQVLHPQSARSRVHPYVAQVSAV